MSLHIRKENLITYSSVKTTKGFFPNLHIFLFKFADDEIKKKTFFMAHGRTTVHCFMRKQGGLELVTANSMLKRY